MKPKHKSLLYPNTMYAFCAPALALFLVFWIFPIFQMFYYSFTNFNGINYNYTWTGLRNYGALLKDGTLGNSLKNTLIYTVIMVVFSNALGLVIALLLNTKIKAKAFFRTACFIPALFSAIVVGFIWSYVYMPGNGMIASLITALGGDGAAFNIIGNYKTALYAISVVEIWKVFGSTMLIYLAGLQTVDDTLLEAARIDGCNHLQEVTKIKIPLLQFTITINTVLSVIGGLKAFDFAFIMTNGGPGKATNTLMFTIYRVAFTEQRMGRASALSVVSFLVIIMVTFFLLMYMNKKEIDL